MEDGVSQVVVCQQSSAREEKALGSETFERTICRHVEIVKKVVRQGLTKIGSVHLKGHEHDAGPKHDAKVDLANQSVFFNPGPPS